MGLDGVGADVEGGQVEVEGPAGAGEAGAVPGGDVGADGAVPGVALVRPVDEDADALDAGPLAAAGGGVDGPPDDGHAAGDGGAVGRRIDRPRRVPGDLGAGAAGADGGGEQEAHDQREGQQAQDRARATAPPAEAGEGQRAGPGRTGRGPARQRPAQGLR